MSQTDPLCALIQYWFANKDWRRTTVLLCQWKLHKLKGLGPPPCKGHSQLPLYSQVRLYTLPNYVNLIKITLSVNLLVIHHRAAFAGDGYYTHDPWASQPRFFLLTFESFCDSWCSSVTSSMSSPNMVPAGTLSWKLDGQERINCIPKRRFSVHWPNKLLNQVEIND